MKFRQHRGSLEESMKTLVEIEPTQKAVLEVAKDMLPPRALIREEDISSEPYRVDPILVQIYIICCPIGVLGFSDSALEIAL